MLSTARPLQPSPYASDRVGRESASGVRVRLVVAVLLSALAPTAHAETPAVRLETGGQEWIHRDDSFEIVFGPGISADTSIAVVIAGVDRSDLFRRTTSSSLVYRPELAPLPRGESTVEVYQVAADGTWRELARLPLRVRHRGGIESVTASARAVVSGVEPITDTAGGSTPVRVAGRSSWTADLTGAADIARSGWNLRSNAQVFGAAERTQRLSFATDGKDAAAFDLANYTVELAHRKGFVLGLGNRTISRQRLLANGFAARGIELRWPVAQRFTLGFSATSGSLGVGFDDLVGLDRPDHHILSGLIGVELLARPGALRLEGSWLDGRVEPLGSFNSAFVEGGEVSSGWGLRLAGATPQQRLRFDAAFARSRFDSGVDAQLDAGLAIVETEAETRDARYAELTADLLRRSFAGGGEASLVVVLRHQRVDPLYRVVGLGLQSDREDHSGELQIGLGPVRATVLRSAFADNLDDLPTVIETRNRRWSATLTVPLDQLRASATAAPPPWLPLLSYAFDTNHQFGLGVPPGTDLRPDQIPDQVSVLHNLGLDWQGVWGRVGYRYSLANQDNRQPGRETADFETSGHTLSLGRPLAPGLELGIDLSREQLANRAQNETQTTERVGLTLNWRRGPWSAGGSVGSTQIRDNRDNRSSDALDADLQIAWNLAEKRWGRRAASGQFFLRGTLRELESVDRVFVFSTDSRAWAATGGLSLNFF